MARANVTLVVGCTNIKFSTSEENVGHVWVSQEENY